MKKFTGDINILHMCTKNHNHMMYGSWDTEWDRQIFCHFRSFLPFYHCAFPPGDILLYIHVYYKWRSNDIWFLKYDRWLTENFVILDHFLPFQTPDNLENQNFKIEKNTWRYYHFTYLHHKWQSYDAWFLRYQVQQTE